MEKNLILIISLFSFLITACSENSDLSSSSKADIDGLWYLPSKGMILDIEKQPDGNINTTTFELNDSLDSNISRSGHDLKLEFRWAESILRELGASESTPGYYIFSKISADSMSLKEFQDYAGDPHEIHFDEFLLRLRSHKAKELFEVFQKNHQLKFQDSASEEEKQELKNRMMILAEQILQEENSLSARSFMMEAIFQNGNMEELETKIGEWGDELETHPNPYVNLFLDEARKSIKERALTAKGENGFYVLRDWLDHPNGLPGRISNIQQIQDTEDYIIPMESLLFFFSLPNFFDTQTSSKVLAHLSTFELLRGNFKKACELAFGLNRIGQILQKGDSTLSLLVGVAIQNIAAQQLEIIALNADVTAEELRWFLDELKKYDGLNDKIRAISFMDLLDARDSFLPPQPRQNTDRFIEASMRFNMAHVRIQLMRAAATARYQALTRNEWPVSPTDLMPAIKEDYLRDPYSENLLLISNKPELLSIYSTGPDKDDDSALIDYDPSNGTISNGDIITRIHPTRKYPFPREGIMGWTESAIRQQFPNGLPYDHFANKRKLPLSITTTNNGTFIYSFGPDADQGLSNQNHPEVQYDPTNGTISNGDLVMKVR